MRLRLLYLAALAAVGSLAIAGCDHYPWETDGGGGNTTQTVIVALPGGASGVPTEPPPGNCPSVETVQVQAKLGGTGGAVVTSFAAGSVVTMDATPKNGSQAVDARCHGPSVSWAASRSDCRFLGATSGFNPEFTCDGEGPVTVTAVVAAPGGVGTAGLTVTP